MGGVFLVGIAGALGLAGALDRIRVEDGLLKDAAGRARVFHGVNVVYKAPPWHPRIDAFSSNDSLVDEDMAHGFVQDIQAIRGSRNYVFFLDAAVVERLSQSGPAGRVCPIGSVDPNWIRRARPLACC